MSMPSASVPPPAGAVANREDTGMRPTALAAILSVALIAGVVILATGVILLQANSARQPAAPAVATVGEGTGWGPVDAPVKISEFSDFG